LEPSNNGTIDEHDPYRGRYRLVGHGSVTNKWCRKFVGMLLCPFHQWHDKTPNGEDVRGKTDALIIIHSCDRPSCPKCYKAWASQCGKRVQTRLLKASGILGLDIEHVVYSFPPDYWGVPESTLRKMAIVGLKARGVIAGFMAFHGTRYRSRWEALRKNTPIGRNWEPHYHIVGFITTDYKKCRACHKHRRECKSCDGFGMITRRENKKDSCVCKILGKRVYEIRRTVEYELKHATYDSQAKSPRVGIWFGACSYSKLKSPKVEREKPKCRLCGADMIPHEYVGLRSFVTDEESPDFQRRLYVDFKEGGRDAWASLPERLFYRYWKTRGMFENPTYLGGSNEGY
jgi:hypothetical protein